MFTFIGVLLLFIIVIMNILIVCGFPLGEFTMGGQYKILPKKFRSVAVVSIAVQLFAIVIILQSGGFISLWFSFKATKYICFIFAAYLSLNTLMNLFSKSKKEKYVMGPLAFITAICFWITAFYM